MKNTIETKRIKHLAACKKWRDNNRKKYREVALAYANKKKAANPEKYLKIGRERAKKHRLNNLAEYQKKEREKSRLRRNKDKEAYNREQREYRRKNPEKFRQYYRKKDPEIRKMYSRLRLLRKYNLTIESYNALLLKQEGKCAICKTLFENARPHIDHCHNTGVVRGLLCGACNIVLGYIEKVQKRTPGIYESFAEYLK